MEDLLSQCCANAEESLTVVGGGKKQLSIAN